MRTNALTRILVILAAIALMAAALGAPYVSSAQATDPTPVPGETPVVIPAEPTALVEPQVVEAPAESETEQHPPEFYQTSPYVRIPGDEAAPTMQPDAPVELAPSLGGYCTRDYNPFVTRAPLPLDLFGNGVVTDGVYVYTVGGYNGVIGGDTQFARYNPSNNIWTSLAPIPAATYEAQVVYAEGKIFVFGGLNASSVPVNTVRIYTIATGIWSLGTSMPGPRFQSAGGNYADRIFVVGGFSSDNVATAQNQTWEYNIAGNSWNVRAVLPVFRAGLGAGVVGNSLFVMGGRDQGGGNMNTTYEYSILGNSWSAKAAMPYAANYPASAAYGKTIWVMGGGLPFDSDGWTQIYDTVDNTWSMGPSQLTPTSFNGAAVIRNQIYVVGGYNGSSVNITQLAEQNPLNILILYADAATPTVLQESLGLHPGVGQVDLFDGRNGTPTLSYLATYDVVMVFSNMVWNDPAAVGNLLADFEDIGGVVVAFNFDWYGSNQSVGGRWVSAAYTPFNQATNSRFSTDVLGAYLAYHPLMLRVSHLSAYYRQVMTLAAGAVQVAAWQDGLPLIAVKGNAVGVNAYIGQYSSDFSGEYTALVVNAGYWLRHANGSCWMPVCSEATVINGSLLATDFSQSDRLFRTSPASTCGAAKACPGTSTAATVFDYYWFTNNTASVQCVTVTLDPKTCIDTTGIHSSAYLNTYNVADRCGNYLGDMGPSSSVQASYAFQVPARAAYTVVVNTVNASTECPAYTVTISAGACPLPVLNRLFLPTTIR